MSAAARLWHPAQLARPILRHGPRHLLHNLRSCSSVESVWPCLPTRCPAFWLTSRALGSQCWPDPSHWLLWQGCRVQGRQRTALLGQWKQRGPHTPLLLKELLAQELLCQSGLYPVQLLLDAVEHVHLHHVKDQGLAVPVGGGRPPALSRWCTASPQYTSAWAFAKQPLPTVGTPLALSRHPCPGAQRCTAREAAAPAIPDPLRTVHCQ